jgi:transposase InsO family protein
VLTDKEPTTPGNLCSAAKAIRAALDAGECFWPHAFALACARAEIDHRLTKPFHPWTNGQVERINRTIKDATVRNDHDQYALRAH